MADEIHSFAVNIPAATARAAPLIFNLNFPPQAVLEVRVRVPPGPRGEVGFQIGQAGVQRYPAEAGAFIVTDNREVIWSLEKANTSGAWQLLAYNTGSFNHSLQVDFLTSLIDVPTETAPLPIANSDLGSAASRALTPPAPPVPPPGPGLAA